MTTVLLLLLKIIDSCKMWKGTYPAFVTCAGASFSALPSPEGCLVPLEVNLRSLQEPPRSLDVPVRPDWPWIRGSSLDSIVRKWLFGDAVGCSLAVEMHCDMWYHVNLGSSPDHVVTASPRTLTVADMRVWWRNNIIWWKMWDFSQSEKKGDG